MICSCTQKAAPVLDLLECHAETLWNCKKTKSPTEPFPILQTFPHNIFSYCTRTKSKFLFVHNSRHSDFLFFILFYWNRRADLWFKSGRKIPHNWKWYFFFASSCCSRHDTSWSFMLSQGLNRQGMWSVRDGMSKRTTGASPSHLGPMTTVDSVQLCAFRKHSMRKGKAQCLGQNV